MEELQAQRNQQIPSPTKGEGAQESTMQEAYTKKRQEILEVHKELESTPRQSATSVQEQMEEVLQNPQ